MMLLILLHLLWLISLPVTWCFSFKIVRQYERGMIFRLGRLLPLQEPGMMYVIPCIDKHIKVDMRTKAFNVPPQLIYTVDNGVVKIGADVQYRITDPFLCYGLVQDVNHMLRVTAQAALNSTLSGKRLLEIESDKQFIGVMLQTSVNKAVATWGIEIGRFELSQSLVIKNPAEGPADFNNDQDPATHVMNLLKQIISPDSTSPKSTNQSVTSSRGLSTVELFELTRSVIDTSLVREVAASFLVRVIGEADWFLDLKHLPGSCKQGPPSSTPDIVMTVSSDDLKLMFYGQLEPREAYLGNRLLIEGDLQTALRLKHVVTRVMSQASAGMTSVQSPTLINI